MPFRIERFTKSLASHADPQAGAQLLQGRPPFETLTTPVQTVNWIGSLMVDLDQQLGPELANAVMEDCGQLCIGQSVLQKARQLQQQAADLDDLLARLNQAHIGGGQMRREGNKIHAAYPRCYCGSVSKTRQPISTTYCQCSCGWFKRLFETLLEKPVQVTLVDSIIHGADACRFIISI